MTQSFGALAVCLFISPYLFLCFLGFSLITFVLLGVIIAMWFANLTKSKQAYGQANGYADQALQHMKVVATYGREFLE